MYSQELQHTRDVEDVKDKNEPRSSRYVHWFAFLVFSMVTLASAIEASDKEHDNPRIQANQEYAVGSSAFSSIVTVFAFCIIDTPVEGIFIFILMCLWAANVAVVSNSQNGLAVNEYGVVVSGNLYYFSWGSFVCGITLFVSHLRSFFHIDVGEELRIRGARLHLWTALMVFCLVMMASSATIFDQYCGRMKGYFCDCTVLSVSIGAVGVLLSLIIIGLKLSAVTSLRCETVLSAHFFILLSCGVALITSEKGPGAPLGNLYYSAWAAFICTFLIGASVLEEYDAARKRSLAEEEAEIDLSPSLDVEDDHFQDFRSVEELLESEN
mmetsp:Transcript_40763/g.49639  ORF Transcript_40763/g.49639 Transcript_40763/m.49639 type:complete len:325 (-) Transcript_40763:49-1023(-)